MLNINTSDVIASFTSASRNLRTASIILISTFIDAFSPVSMSSTPAPSGFDLDFSKALAALTCCPLEMNRAGCATLSEAQFCCMWTTLRRGPSRGQESSQSGK
jgi:hypothetical protein